MRAASDLMMERGGADFQMSEVSERCHLSKGSLYYYFSDRNALVTAICNQVMDEFVERCDALVAQAASALDALTAVVGEFTARTHAERPLNLAFMRMVTRADSGSTEMVTIAESRMRRVIDLLAAQLERGKQEGTISREIDSGVTAVSLVGSFLLMAIELAGTQKGSDAPFDGGEILRAVMQGIGTREGCELLGKSSN